MSSSEGRVNVELTGKDGGKTDGQCRSSWSIRKSSVSQNLLKVAHFYLNRIFFVKKENKVDFIDK